MNVLDLFSGIGGFSLGLERAGMRTVAFCEIEPYCRAVLRKHWPTIRIYEDVRTLTVEQLWQDGTAPDLICGGFPCQDISLAGKGAGLLGDRSALWFEYHRLIGECRPAWALIENVTALRSRGLDTVLGGLAEIGYDAEWYCIPAAAVGAPHQRDRIWIVAYPHDTRLEGRHGGELQERPGERAAGPRGPRLKGYITQLLANAESNGRQPRRAGDSAQKPGGRQLNRSRVGANDVADADREQTRRIAEPWGERNQWLSEPDVGRVANGVPARVDRLRALGNAVVPQIPEIIGRAIMRAEAAGGG